MKSDFKLFVERITKDEFYNSINKKYKDKIIHFTDIEKIGIRPFGAQSQMGDITGNPLGIYGYIIGYPMAVYAKTRKYYYIIEPKRNTVIINNDGRSNIDSKIPEIVNNIINEYNLKQERIKKIVKNDRYIRNPMTYLLVATGLAASGKDDEGYFSVSGAKWNNVLRKYDIEAIIDYGSQTLYPSEPYVAYISSTNNTNIIDFGENPEYTLETGDLITQRRRGKL